MDKTCKNCTHWQQKATSLKPFKDEKGEFEVRHCRLIRYGSRPTRNGAGSACGISTGSDFYCAQFQPIKQTTSPSADSFPTV
jgi:hypothetical protein